MQSPVIKVIVLDDHALVRAGIRSTLADTPSIEIVGEGSAGEHLEPLVREHRPDVVLLDLMMPQQEGESVNNGAILFRPARAVKMVRKQYPGTEFIVISHMSTSNVVVNLANAGVNGYLLKYDGLSIELATAIMTVHRGGVCLSAEISRTLATDRHRILREKLSDRHVEVLQALAIYSNELHRDIAFALNISEATMKKHIGEIRQRLGVKTTTAAIIKGIQLGIVPLDAISFPEY